MQIGRVARDDGSELFGVEFYDVGELGSPRAPCWARERRKQRRCHAAARRGAEVSFGLVSSVKSEIHETFCADCLSIDYSYTVD